MYPSTILSSFSRGRCVLKSAHCSNWSNLLMPEGLTTQERLLAGAIPSQEFKKSHPHNRKQDPRLALFPASRFLWSLCTRLSGQVLKIFIIILDSPVESHLSTGYCPTCFVCYCVTTEQTAKKKDRKQDKKKITSRYLLSNAAVHPYWCCFLMSDMLLC